MNQQIKQTRLEEDVPHILQSKASDSYALIDSGEGRKLEQYGPYLVDRPEAQALWQKSLPKKRWDKADAVFSTQKDEEASGRWQFPNTPLGETWPLSWEGMNFWGRFTAFRHVGVFPEQAAHWQFLHDEISKSTKQPRLLNLFGYTGIASLVAARAGAHVTHVDASKKAILWAKENQEMASLNDKPIRWICDDAVKFCEREVRRGNSYDAIILDPPKYGRGPKGETWHLLEGLPNLLSLCGQLTSDHPLFVVLTSYSIRSSFYAMHELMRDVYAKRGGRLQSGELVLTGKEDGRTLSTSLFSRWTAKAH